MKFKLHIPEDSDKKLIQDIEKFAKKSKLSCRTVGRRGIGDNHLMERLRAGRSITLRKLEKLYTFMRTYKPKAKK